jgi:hypothetical protein
MPSCKTWRQRFGRRRTSSSATHPPRRTQGAIRVAHIQTAATQGSQQTRCTPLERKVVQKAMGMVRQRLRRGGGADCKAGRSSLSPRSSTHTHSNTVEASTSHATYIEHAVVGLHCGAIEPVRDVHKPVVTGDGPQDKRVSTEKPLQVFVLRCMGVWEGSKTWHSHNSSGR